MQLKTIKKTIAEKLNSWLETITDESLRAAIKDNLLVSGGSITSMLLNEPVNDFDIYIKTTDVLVRLCEYYATPKGIQILKGWEKVKLMEGYNSGILEKSPEYKNMFIVAVDNLKDNQVKLFTTGELFNQEATPEENEKFILKYISPNAISLSNQIQIVVRFTGDSKQIHETFDFLHATNYFTFSEGLVTNKEALESIITKQLRYQGSQYPLTSIIRMKKFIKRGWNINAGEILKIMFQISELDLKNANTLEEQLIGVDVAYFGKLIEILRGLDDKTKMTSQYLNTIIDSVSNEYDGEV